jgi:uncharacterized membrane protein required for colicin V production
MNITLIIVILIIIVKAIRGFQKGMTREISSLIAWTVTLFVMSIVLMFYSSLHANEAGNTIYSLIILVVVGLVYGVVRLFLKSAKLIAKLPVFHFLDQVLGFVVGLGEGMLIVWLLYVLNEGGLFGSFSEMISNDTASNAILSLIYEYNYLAKLAAGL